MDTHKDFFSLEPDKLFADDAANWVVITSHAQHFIGRLEVEAGNAVELQKQIVELQKFEPVALYPAFEFSPMMVAVPRQGPNGQPVQGFARQPFISTPHFTIEPLKIRVQPTSYYLFSDMKEKDQELYKGFVMTAITQAKNERLARSNLVAPTAKERGLLAKGPNGA